ncbi:MAG: PadR family transcriptional regulator [Solirubrobacterales bacterium]
MASTSNRPKKKTAAKQPAKRVAKGASARSTQEAVAEAAAGAAGQYLREQRDVMAAVETVVDATAPVLPKRAAADPLVSELRRQLLPLLVLHFVSEAPTYGNQLIDRITELTGGVLTVNPNTMYPMLRGFESRGLIEGQWEHPERRSRRFYALTGAGEAELQRLKPGAREALDELGKTLGDIRDELRD